MKVSVAPISISVKASVSTANVTTGTPIAKEYLNVEPYTGDYTFTPSDSTQTIETTGKRLTDDIVINPIPSNYGLITWNGSTLTVS